MNTSDTLLMLGRDHAVYGEISRGSLGPVAACLSVGADTESPSLAFKADKALPNEDALLAKRSGDLYLLAVADAHFGHLASHLLLERLAERQLPRRGPGEEGAVFELMELCLSVQRPHQSSRSGTTLLVALYASRTGRVLALSTGDSTLGTLSSAGWRVRNEHNHSYLGLDLPSYPDEWDLTEFTLEPESLLILHTDGVDECHYRQPETSIRSHHMESLWKGLSSEPPESLELRVGRFSEALTRMALEGVDGHPGGQDNIALLALAHPGV